jgi:hypothetical protein
MGRLSKAVLLSLLLILAGVPGTASQLCAQTMTSRAHACCMRHAQMTASHCGAASMQLGNRSCCKVAPIESTPARELSLTGGANDGAYGLHATSGLAGMLATPVLVSGRGSPRRTKLQHLPVHALLCTFLV